MTYRTMTKVLYHGDQSKSIYFSPLGHEKPLRVREQTEKGILTQDKSQ